MWVDSARYSYTYNQAGEMLTQLDESWTNNQWVGIDVLLIPMMPKGES